jgi:hypothetical protein
MLVKGALPGRAFFVSGFPDFSELPYVDLHVALLFF